MPRSLRLGLALALLAPGCGSPPPEAAPTEVELPMKSRTALHPALDAHIREQVIPAVSDVPAARRATLDELAGFVRERRATGQTAALTFICTHNSRRSQMGQIWAATAAAWFGVSGVETFSGGTESTAFNPRAVAALRRAGVAIDDPGGDNPRHQVTIGSDHPGLECFSKRFEQPPNPSEGFAAIMTCSAADASCPTVRGAKLRVALPYEDPKVADGTPEEAARYDERSRQIAAEMFYLFSRVSS